MKGCCGFRSWVAARGEMSECGVPCVGRYCDQHHQVQAGVHEARIKRLTEELQSEKGRLAQLRTERRGVIKS